MRVHPLSLGFLLLHLLCFCFCNADTKTFEIVGVADCADCQLNNIKTSHAFSGLHVTIDCKVEKEMKRVGEGELDEAGNFKISLPKEMMGVVTKKCYAQLHSAAAAPCPAHGGLDATQIVSKSQIDHIITFSPAKALQFSTALCTSKLLWPFFQYPPLPKIDPWKKLQPTIPWTPWYPSPHHKPKPKPKPKRKPPVVKPLPPPAPIYKPKPEPKPKTPVVKPLPPPVPIYKPKPKPLPPAVPVYKPPTKPMPPPFPKPTPKPPVPIYEPPVVTKPLPPPSPLFPFPPIYKKPCPPFAKIPPKNLFDHPKFGYFPQLPPFNP